jgi:MFS family permease
MSGREANDAAAHSERTTRGWVTWAVIGIVCATFLSDVGHEMATATLPLYLGSIGFTAAGLGLVEGLADLLFSLSKLAGGYVGHRVNNKRVLAALGYLVTALGTAGMALASSLSMLASMRGAAWLGSGFRSPLRDFMLADEVGATHFGRAYGIERAADMLGAVAGPLVAAALLWSGIAPRGIIIVSLVPSLGAVLTFFLMTRDRHVETTTTGPSVGATPLPRRFWLLVAGVGLFGLGDFSRTFLILLAATAFGELDGDGTGSLSLAVLLYAGHNLVSACAAYPAGYLGDRGSKLRVLRVGYGLGVLTNVLLAFSEGSHLLLVGAILLSGVYIAIEETVEKAVAAEMLPRQQRSLGLGILAAANALGDMVSSVGVGWLIASGHSKAAFLAAATMGAAGLTWMMGFVRDTPSPRVSQA